MTHTHTGLGANDALHLRQKQTPIQEKITKWKNIEKQEKLPIIYYLLALCYNSLLMFKIILCKSYDYPHITLEEFEAHSVKHAQGHVFSK